MLAAILCTRESAPPVRPRDLNGVRRKRRDDDEVLFILKEILPPVLAKRLTIQFLRRGRP